jgi:uncharacterized protein
MHTNQLSLETSPYLLQHAHNPVNWVAWNDVSLAMALNEDKPIILSIGYSACHWCHVMEHESFENEQVAQIMNDYFVCIKVDREERPDVDAIYMDAVQAMGIHGGWPLNIFLMPDGKPFYGGTYFPANKWAGLCHNIAEAFVNNRTELQNSANGFANNLSISESEKYNLGNSQNNTESIDLEDIVSKIMSNIDPIWGGMAKTPKFPMPSIWLFLLQFYKHSKNENLKQNLFPLLQNTFEKLAMGGIFDQIGGGFSRYSVDGEWFCPHFEKMLYDNGQLLSVYAEAYKQTKNELYKEIIAQTIGWLKRDVLTKDGAFFSAQDADSEGIEGKFYIWSKSEIDAALGSKSESFCNAYQVSIMGNWENGENILWKNKPILNKNFQNEIDILLNIRNKRIFPGLDDKILCSWNALMVSGLVDAFSATQIKEYLDLAVNCCEFINANFYKNNHLYRTFKNGETKILGFLEDYATVISAYISLYQVTFNENWLSLAESLTLKCLNDFYDENEQFFCFSDRSENKLIANKIELFDNVIPCSNSIMAHNLYDLGILLSRTDFVALSKQMLDKMNLLIIRNGEYLSNWANLAVKMQANKIEIVIYGPMAVELNNEIVRYNLPNVYILASESVSNLPLFQHRKPPENKTFIYVCTNNACALPVETAEEAILLISPKT